MRRRVGSAKAAKVRFKVSGEYLTIWLNIYTGNLDYAKHFLPQIWLSALNAAA
jgi:hypothetical protein